MFYRLVFVLLFVQRGSDRKDGLKIIILRLGVLRNWTVFASVNQPVMVDGE